MGIKQAAKAILQEILNRQQAGSARAEVVSFAFDGLGLELRDSDFEQNTSSAETARLAGGILNGTVYQAACRVLETGAEAELRRLAEALVALGVPTNSIETAFAWAAKERPSVPGGWPRL